MAFFSLIGVILIAYHFFKFKNDMKAFVKMVMEFGMDKDDLRELVQREFVLMLKDDELFKKHIENKVMK